MTKRELIEDLQRYIDDERKKAELASAWGRMTEAFTHRLNLKILEAAIKWVKNSALKRKPKKEPKRP